jgi:hypothetical protein
MKIFILAFFLAVTFFQSLHGVFSAMIMLVLCLLCSTVALTHFEWLHNTLLASFMPDYGQAVALAALFVIPLGVLRVGIDKLISGNMVLPTLVDRIGAPLIGVGTGLIVSGVIALVFQLLPFDAELLGFQRIIATRNGEPVSPTTRLIEVPIAPDIEFTRDSLWLSPDGLTVSLASVLGSNVFGAEPSFGDVHPDFLVELHWRRFGTQRESRDWVAPDALAVREAKVLGANDLWVYKVPEQTFGSSPIPVPDTTRPPDAGNHYVAVIVTLRNDKDTTDAQNTHRFRGGQFRLVCRDPRTRESQHFPMTGICYKPGALGDDGKWQYFHQFRGTIVGETGEGLGVAFEVPERLEPWFVEYKASARAAVPPIKVSGGAVRPPGASPSSVTSASPSSATPAARPASPPPSRPAPAGAGEGGQASGGTGGGRDRVSGRYVREGVSRFSDELPIPIREGVLIEQGSDLKDDKLEEGHVAVELSAAGSEDDDAITEFVVPEGKRLLQLWVDRTEAQSIFGRSLQITRETLGQFTVSDQDGEEYHRIGELRVADVQGRETLEIQYWPSAEMPERSIREFRTVKNNHMTGEYSLVYFYLIPEGRQPQRFNVGGGKSRAVGPIEGE